MKTATQARRGIAILFTCILLLLPACQAETSNSLPASPNTGISTTATETALPPVNPEETEIIAGIQKTLDGYNSGLEKNDKTLFMNSIDRDSKMLKESTSSNFDVLETTGFPQTVKLGMKVAGIKTLSPGLVLTKIIRDRDGWIANWYFRKVDDRWVLTEPTLEETGAPQTSANGNYTFTTYPIAEDVNAEYIALMENARVHVQKDLGKAPNSKVKINVFPAAAMSPYVSGDLSGWYISPDANGTDDIYILAPTTYFFGFYDPKTGWEPDIETLLTHELARITYVREFGNPGQGVDWFFEGLPEYVAGYDQRPYLKDAIQNDTIIPILDPSEKKADLAHFANLQNGPLAYGLAESLVAFIVEKYGGLDTFWALAKSYDKTQDIQTAIQETLGISYEEFDAAWRTWLKAEYINRG
jgi:hypothetical protein